MRSGVAKTRRQRYVKGREGFFLVSFKERDAAGLWQRNKTTSLLSLAIARTSSAIATAVGIPGIRPWSWYRNLQTPSLITSQVCHFSTTRICFIIRLLILHWAHMSLIYWIMTNSKICSIMRNSQTGNIVNAESELNDDFGDEIVTTLAWWKENTRSDDMQGGHQRTKKTIPSLESECMLSDSTWRAHTNMLSQTSSFGDVSSSHVSSVVLSLSPRTSWICASRIRLLICENSSFNRLRHSLLHILASLRTPVGCSEDANEH